MDKLKLDPISALVFKWGINAFDRESIEKFINHVDFSSAEKLDEECKSICTWYEEVILNSKFFIIKTIEEEFQKTSGEHIILNLSAGKSPLAIHLLSRNKDRISRIIEVDNSGMEEKQEIYDRFYPEFSSKIKCISAEITSESFLVFLKEIVNEYFNGNPCIIILEGIVYYLKQDDFIKIVNKFISKGKSNTLIVEYLLPETQISGERKEIPQKILNRIKEELNLDSVSAYQRESINKIFSNTGGRLVTHKSLMDLEKERTGKNKYFNEVEDGWIECSAWKL